MFTLAPVKNEKITRLVPLLLSSISLKLCKEEKDNVISYHEQQIHEQWLPLYSGKQ